MPPKSKASANAQVAWKNPEPTSFLDCPGAMIPAIRGDDLKKLTKFKKTTVAKMDLGEPYYFMYTVGKEESWGHLGRPFEIAGKMIRVHFANCNLLTGAENFVHEYFLDMELTCPDQAYIIPAEHIASPAVTVAVDEAKIRLLIEADKTIKRTEVSERRTSRVDMLTRAVSKALQVNSKELVEAAKSEEDMTALMTVYVDEAISDISQEREVAASVDSADCEAANFGMIATNYGIAAQVLMKTLNPKSQQLHDSQEVVNLALEMRKGFKALSQQLELLALVKPKPVEEAKALEKVAGEVSMDAKDDDCGFHGGGIALQLSEHPLDTILKMPSVRLAKEARQHLVRNFTTIHNTLEDIAEHVDGEHFASAQWKETLGKSPDTLLNDVLQGEARAGIVTLGLITYHTDVEITAVHSESINAKASDERVQVGVYPAMLESLPAGPVKKTKRVFVILKGKHFYFAFIKQGDNRKAIFDIGEEADEAQALIVALVKSERMVPLGDLSEVDRIKAIDKALETKAVSWANLADPKKTRPAADQDKTPPAAAPAGQKNSAPVADAAEQQELCRNYENSQKCRFGDSCKFKHDDSRTAKNRRKRTRKRAELATVVEESRSRNRQPANGGGHKQSRHESPPRRSRDSRGRSRSRSRSSSRDRPRSRSSSGSRSPEPRKPEWTTVATRKLRLRVRCPKSVHPGAWRNALKSISNPAHALVTWVERDLADEEWLQVQCEADDVSKLEKLLQQESTVERQRRRPNKNSTGRTHHCVDFLNGRDCKHSKPCK